MDEQFEYSEKVMEHFRNLRNVGEIKDADGIGRVGNPVCGDLMEIQIKVENNILAVGLTPNTEIFKKLGIELTERGYIKTDKSQKTSIDGIYAVGDVASEVQFTVVAVAHGLIVAHNAYTQLRDHPLIPTSQLHIFFRD